MKVKDCMTTDVITVGLDVTLRELAKILHENNINGVPVVDSDNKVIGVVCESDLVDQNTPLHIPTVFVILDSIIPIENPWRLQKDFKKISATTVEDVYSFPAVCVEPDTDITEAAQIMTTKKFYTIPVVKDGELLGILGKGDIIKAIAQGAL
ncbi:MAG: CBS domain-containing protein [Syntrophaceae bacterium]|nr:CBS domain-containing protein [Syntrophaceae bacterium]